MTGEILENYILQLLLAPLTSTPGVGSQSNPLRKTVRKWTVVSNTGIRPGPGAISKARLLRSHLFKVSHCGRLSVRNVDPNMLGVVSPPSLDGEVFWPLQTQSAPQR